MYDTLNLVINMYKAYKFRIYPNNDQIVLINKTFGCCRFIYNYFLDKCKKNGYTNSFNMCNELKELCKEYTWLKEVDSCSLRCTIFNLEDSYKNFFSKKSGYPIFKSKFNKQSYRTTCIKSTYKGRSYSNIKLDLIKRKIKLPKLGLVDIRGYRNLKEIEGNIINATITKEKTNKYYVSVIVDEKEIKKEKVIPKSIVGIDLGIKDLVVTSNGEKYENKKEVLKYEKRIKRMQRKLSRQIKKIKNSRKHNIISIVNKLVEENDIIISEKLNVKETSKNHRLSKNILDASFNKICLLLK